MSTKKKTKVTPTADANSSAVVEAASVQQLGNLIAEKENISEIAEISGSPAVPPKNSEEQNISANTPQPPSAAGG